MRASLMVGFLLIGVVASAEPPTGSMFDPGLKSFSQVRVLPNGVKVYRDTLRGPDGSLRFSVTQTLIGGRYYKNYKNFGTNGASYSSRVSATATGVITQARSTSSSGVSTVTQTATAGPDQTAPVTTIALPAFDPSKLGRSLQAPATTP